MADKASIALGRIAALERVVALLIASHPTPDALSSAWQGVMPGWREEMREEYADDPDFLRAAMAALDRFERHIQRIAAAAMPQGAAPSSH